MDQFASLQNFSNPHVASVLQKPLEIHPSLQIKQPVMSLITLEDETNGSSPKMNRKGKSPALIYPVDTLQGHLGIVCAATFASSRGTWKEPSHGQSKKQGINPLRTLDEDTRVFLFSFSSPLGLTAVSGNSTPYQSPWESYSSVFASVYTFVFLIFCEYFKYALSFI